MSKAETTKKVISKWNKGYKDRDGLIIPKLSQVVHLTESGKNKKGKTIFSSKTKHERG